MTMRSLATAMVLLATPGLALAQATPPSPCADPEHGQFDFWVGRWTVSPTGKPDVVVASSLIEKVYGCGVRENWMPKVNSGGGSLSIYVPAQKGWRQTWIDSSGAYVDFAGGWDGRAMVLTGDWPGPDGKPSLTRMTYTKGVDGSVRQAGAVSKDGGTTWTPSFDFTYRRAP
jgi:hypothetical protein